MRVPLGRSRAVSVRLTVRRPAGAQALRTTPPRPRKSSARVSQFSSTAFPAISRAPGRMAALPSSQSCGRGEPSPSTSRFVASTPVAVLVDPVVGHVGRARPDPRVGVVAVGRPADAVAVGVALDLLAGDARVRVVADRGVVAGAAVDLLARARRGRRRCRCPARRRRRRSRRRRTGRRCPRRRRRSPGARRSELTAATSSPPPRSSSTEPTLVLRAVRRSARRRLDVAARHRRRARRRRSG